MAKHSSAVHSFEPNPKNIVKLRRNIGGLANATIHSVALSDRQGRATLRIPRGAKGLSNQGASLSTDAVSDDRDHIAIAVEQKRLDDYGFTSIGFIKIDVEGFEMTLIDGAHRTIARERPNLLIEMEEGHTTMPIEDSVRHVTALGYRCLYLRRGVLTNFSRFDAEAEHRNCETPQDYIYNFIFLPEPA